MKKAQAKVNLIHSLQQRIDMRSQGFTLIELMIVIAIIAILMAYALPAYRDYTVRTKLTEGMSMGASYKLSVNEAYVRVGTLSGLVNDTAGIPGASALGNCVNNIDVDQGIITVSYDCAAGSEGVPDIVVDASQLIFTPSTQSSGGLTWRCDAVVPNPDQDPC